ncbi:MAG TPA: hypothetical protein DEA55_04475 [Rhodospirillaceae bacterium]|nr:hypothetical protein [Rhodospirillaceae bacterium]
MEPADPQKSIDDALKKPSRKKAGFLAAVWLVAMTGSSPLEDREPVVFDMDLSDSACSRDGHVVTFESHTQITLAKIYENKASNNSEQIGQSIARDYEAKIWIPLKQRFRGQSSQDILDMAGDQEEMGRVSEKIKEIVGDAFNSAEAPADDIDVSSLDTYVRYGKLNGEMVRQCDPDELGI